MTKNIEAISLFSGAGGLDLGCELNKIDAFLSVASILTSLMNN